MPMAHDLNDAFEFIQGIVDDMKTERDEEAVRANDLEKDCDDLADRVQELAAEVVDLRAQVQAWESTQ